VRIIVDSRKLQIGDFIEGRLTIQDLMREIAEVIKECE
jgi:hypothetical protein